MNKKRVKFINLGHVEREQSRVRKVLDEFYNWEEVETDPDYVVVGPHQTNSLAPWQDKILISETCEAVVPDFNLVDYAIGFDDLSFGDRYFRMPMSLAKWAAPDFQQKGDGTDYTEREFCNFFYSNPNAHPMRDSFFTYLSGNYKKVDSLGRHLNNVGELQQRFFDEWQGKEDIKLSIQRRYKFSIAFENAAHGGYISEKLLNAFDADSIPIYWGDPHVDKIFNKKAFIWVQNEADFPRAVEQIKKLDTNNDAFMKVLMQPRLKIDLSDWITREDAFIRYIFDQSIPDGKRRGEGTFNDFYLKIHNEHYTRRWYKPGLIRRSQVWHSLHKLTSVLGVYKLLRPLGKKIRHKVLK